MTRILCLIGVFAVVAGGHARAQARSNASRSATEVVSPVAVATWMTTPGSDKIELLVLWRGEARWFLGPGQRHSISSGRTASGFTSTATFGEVTLDLEFDNRTRVARLNGVEVKLPNDNVVLVDKIAPGTTPVVVKTLSITTPMVDGRIASVIRQSDPAVEFLKCSVSSGSPTLSGTFERLCAALGAKF